MNRKILLIVLSLLLAHGLAAGADRNDEAQRQNPGSGKPASPCLKSASISPFRPPITGTSTPASSRIGSSP